MLFLTVLAFIDGQILHGFCGLSLDLFISSLGWVVNGEDIGVLVKEPLLALFFRHSIHAILNWSLDYSSNGITANTSAGDVQT